MGRGGGVRGWEGREGRGWIWGEWGGGGVAFLVMEEVGHDLRLQR